MFLRFKPAIAENSNYQRQFHDARDENVRDFLKLPLLSRVWQMRFDVDVRRSLARRILEIILPETDCGNENLDFNWLRLKVVSWRGLIEAPVTTGAINLIHNKSLIALNLIDMKKFVLLLTAVFGLGVVAQAADPSPSASPAASGAPKKHHHHHKASTSPAATKPSASPKASASPKTS
jgi:hypothetical protein